jgi:CDP-diacylglycerol--serine O-phosphatidyltransferase
VRKWRYAIKKRKFRTRGKRKRRVNIAKLTKISFLPSLFTILSLFMGYLALIQIVKGNFINAVYFIGASVILDGFDGTVARLTKTESNFGVQLDSLVDAVAFGLVTSAMIYFWGFKGLDPQLGKVIGFVFLSAGVIRLARFNVLKEADAMPTNIFVGLPIPLGALAIVSAVLVVGRPLENKSEMLAFAIYVALISFLMISSVKYRTLKRIKSKNNVFILLFLAVIIALSINFPQYAIPFVTLLYMTSPIFFFIINKFKKNKSVHTLTSPVVSTESPSEPGSESKVND